MHPQQMANFQLVTSMTRGGGRAHENVAMTVGFDATFDPGQVPIGEQLGPAPQVERGLRLLLGQFDRQCRHGGKLSPPLRLRQGRCCGMSRPMRARGAARPEPGLIGRVLSCSEAAAHEKFCVISSVAGVFGMNMQRSPLMKTRIQPTAVRLAGAILLAFLTATVGAQRNEVLPVPLLDPATGQVLSREARPTPP
jgi:hypothetical protein